MFYHIVINTAEIMLRFFNSLTTGLLCTIAVAASCLLSSEEKRIKYSMACALLWCCWCFGLCWCTEVLQLSAFNRQRYIDSILFRLYLVGKTIYHSLRIIMTTQYILICYMKFECFTESVVTVISPYNFYVWEARL